MPDRNEPPQPDASRFRTAAAASLFAGALGARHREHEWTPPDLEELARLLPGYEMIALFGRGGMGAVYQARQRSLDRIVAIKLLPSEIGANPALAERFTAEARILARLNHPNIVSVHESGETSEGHFYFVMEYVEGHSLAENIKAGSLTPPRAIEIAGKVCDALRYAHEQGIVHRDVKPGNILLGADGRIKLADFGIARLTLPDGPANGTRTGTVIGTPEYMAPEQLEGSTVDERADLYAVGVVLYEMLCGEVPRGAFLPPSQRVPVDPKLDEIALKAMRPLPVERYQTAADLKTDLERVAASAGVVPRPTRKFSTAANVMASIGVLGIAGALAFGIASTRKKTLPEPGPASPAHPAEAVAPTLDAATSTIPWVNSLGMKFVPVAINGGPTNGQRIFFSAWETRLQDYDVFARETDRPRQRPPYAQEPPHPVTLVSYDDAQSFCAWLTEREHKSGMISPRERYRLPTDHEWSCAIGIGGEEDSLWLPADKQLRLPETYPWGSHPFPPAGFENYSGEEAQDAPAFRFQQFLKGYRDPFRATAPVGSFAPNRLGIFDLSGNVREWTDTWFDASWQTRTMRGASFSDTDLHQFLSSYRAGVQPGVRGIQMGFRIVLGPIPQYRVLPRVAPLRLEADWVDWFAEQQRAGISHPNFRKVGDRWLVTWSGLSLFPSPVRNIAIRVTFRVEERFDLANIILRRRDRGNIVGGWVGQISKDGRVSILRPENGSPVKRPSMSTPGFDPAGELTLQFKVRDRRFGASIDDHQWVTDTDMDDTGDSGKCYLTLPVGSTISRLEYRLPDPF